MHRRSFIKSSFLVALSAALAEARDEKRTPRILLCSAWQVVNIGDIAHTPGALALLEHHCPDVEVILWAFNPLSAAARDLLLRRFPKLEILETKLSRDGQPDAEALAVMDRCDFFLHGSGPATLGWAHALAFAQRTSRSYGVLGVTYGLYGTPERAMLTGARFVYFRDSVSLARAKQEGVRAPIMEWAPDTAFAFDVRDDRKADDFLASIGFERGKFLCCISRFRNTPFWDMPSKRSPFDPAKHARNLEKKVSDAAPLLEAVIAVARETSLKILLCPEDETQMAINRELLWDRLPDDVRPKVVLRETFWLPDEAVSVYERSAGLFGHEMHSPIMCIGRGVPAIVCRWAEQSSKGTMWRDIGLGDWLFDLDVPEEATRVAPAVLAIAKEPEQARARAVKARALVRSRFAEVIPALFHGNG